MGWTGQKWERTREGQEQRRVRSRRRFGAPKQTPLSGDG